MGCNFRIHRNVDDTLLHGLERDSIVVRADPLDGGARCRVVRGCAPCVLDAVQLRDGRGRKYCHLTFFHHHLS